MATYLDLELLSGGRISISVHAKSEMKFRNILMHLLTLPVTEYNKSRNRYVTNIMYMNHLDELCDKLGIDYYCTKRLDRVVRRMQYKIKRIQEQRTNEKFYSKYWTKDKDKQVLPYQAIGINVCYEARGFLMNDVMGLGKTIEALGVICRGFEAHYNKALIICFNKLKGQWKGEIRKFTNFKNKEISIVGFNEKFKCPLKLTKDVHFGREPCRSCHLKPDCQYEKNYPDVRRKKQIESGRLVIINYEILEKEKKNIKKAGFDIFILDEATKLKNRVAKCSKAMLNIIDSAPSDAIVMPMSGTFIENRLEEIYMPIRIIDRRIFGEWHSFKGTYLETDHWGNVVAYHNEDLMKEIIDTWSIRRGIEEVWKDRPPYNEKTLMIEMGPDQERIYNEAKAGVLQDLADLEMQDKINIANIGALINYLLQVAGTTETIDPTKKFSAKMDHIKDMVVDQIGMDSKILIFSFFGNKIVPLIKRELDSLGYGKALTITGRTKDVEKVKRKFRKYDKYRYLVCSDAMAYGGNLQFLNYIINYDLPWNPARLSQRIFRIYRRGQMKPVFVTNLCTVGTMEERVLEVIGYKKKIFEQFIEGRSVKIKKLGLKTLLRMLKS